jgi:hypothetical protein
MAFFSNAADYWRFNSGGQILLFVQVRPSRRFGKRQGWLRDWPRFMRTHLLLLALVLAPVAAMAQASAKGILLEDLTWVEAEKVLTSETVVVIPLGAESKEHGPHLKLKNDWLIAEYLKKEVLARSNVVIAPTINYHYFPAFLEYPGST